MILHKPTIGKKKIFIILFTNLLIYQCTNITMIPIENIGKPLNWYIATLSLYLQSKFFRFESFQEF
ncbi:hypothetical protein AU378_01165 [Chryseobacterium kwangjuense]|uniref:Uncharacterized protein n=1 Tax=Chryseobacterium kwangjuense TaxID=267125 RepID=A0A135WHK4_9FLAO|nr:hypothetical protein AU378_01165 [Chryseobacterium kwangjuense]